MRIHRLRLRNVKGVAERDVEFPHHGVVVVEGENEVGKTTMIEALDLLFDEKDSSRKRHVLALRPVGQDVPSVVEAEVSSGPYRFTYRKQWFRQPSTVLTVTAPRREDHVGALAHDRARAILAETTDLSLWRALRLMQASPLGQVELASSAALATALDAAAGRAPADGDTAGDSLVARAEAAYLEHYTPTGRETGDYRVARLAVADATDARDVATEAIDEVAADVRRHARLVSELARLEQVLSAATRERDALARDVEEVGELESRRDEAAQEAAAADATLDLQAERAETRATLDRRIAARRADLVAQEEALARAREEVSATETHLQAVLRDRTAALAEQEAARRVASAADADDALLADLADLAGLTERLADVETALEGRRAARAAAQVARVDLARLRAVEEAARRLDLALAEQRAGSARLVVTALGDGTILTAGRAESTLRAGEEHQRDLVEPLDVEVPGHVRLRFVPEAGAAGRAEAVAAARAALRGALDQAGGDSLVHVRELHEEHRRAGEDRERAERHVVDLLRGDDADGLRDRRRLLAEHTAERLADRGDLDLPGDRDAARALLAGARRQEESARGRARALDAQASAARRAAQDARVRLARTEALHDAAATHLEEEAARLSTLRAQLPDDELAELVAQAAERRDVARASRADLEAVLRSRDPASLRARLEAVEVSLPELTRRRDGVRDERVGLEARLRLAGSQGRHDAVAAAELALADARREFAALDRRARAARLLHETLQRHRAQARRAYVEPFGQAVTRLGRVVYGPTFDIEVGRGLSLDARLLDGRRIPYDALSSGAKEQLAILTRLACAGLVDPEQGAPVVIDDALGYSDPDKLRRVCAAFSLVGAGAQVLLLTCTPDRYAAIAGAHVIRL